MISQTIGELRRRRNSLQASEKGFTLIELLVVIVIIGILAAIAIPVYLGVQNNAKDSAAKADLANAKTAVVAYVTDKTTYPSSVSDGTTLAPYGFAGTTVAWSGTAPTGAATTFCLVITSPTTKTFYATDSSGVVATKPTTGC